MSRSEKMDEESLERVKDYTATGFIILVMGGGLYASLEKIGVIQSIPEPLTHISNVWINLLSSALILEITNYIKAQKLPFEDLDINTYARNTLLIGFIGLSFYHIGTELFDILPADVNDMWDTIYGLVTMQLIYISLQRIWTMIDRKEQINEI